MPYSSTADLIALLRQTRQGMRTVRMPGLDYVVSAMARAGLFTLYIGQTPPAFNQSSTVWFLPSASSWAAEGIVFLWNAATAQYEVASPALWSTLLKPIPGAVVQDVAIVGPVVISNTATIVRVLNVSAPVSLTLPLSSVKSGGVLVTDWANSAGTNAITINLSGGDILPMSGNSYKINGDGGSVFFRPVPGGYAI